MFILTTVLFVFHKHKTMKVKMTVQLLSNRMTPFHFTPMFQYALNARLSKHWTEKNEPTWSASSKCMSHIMQCFTFGYVSNTVNTQKTHDLHHLAEKLHCSIQVFRMQKKAIRIIRGRGNRESCRNLFKELNILPLMSQYILSLHLCQIIQNSILQIRKYTT